jgi:hypothetical protein
MSSKVYREIVRRIGISLGYWQNRNSLGVNIVPTVISVNTYFNLLF